LTLGKMNHWTAFRIYTQ